MVDTQLTNLVVLNVGHTPAGGHAGFNLTLPRDYTPFYCMVFEWTPSANTFFDYVWAFDIGLGTHKRIVSMPGYFRLAEQRTVDSTVQYVNRKRADFQGDRILIGPPYNTFLP